MNAGNRLAAGQSFVDSAGRLGDVIVLDSHLKDERWTRAIIDSIGDGIVVADREGNLLLFNPAAERILGIGLTSAKPDRWSETYGIFLPDGVTPCPSEELPLFRAIHGESVEERELVIRNPSRDINIRARATPMVDASGQRVGGVVVFHDITEQKRTMEAMTRAERLISIGTLAAGVAHELNNPVGAMVLTAEDALVNLDHKDAAHGVDGALRRILSQAQRCAEIVKRILRFADQQTSEKTPEDLRPIALHAIDIVKHKAKKKGIQCHFEVTGTDCRVVANATELGQVIVNLLSNAIQASEAGTHIKIGISAGDEHLELAVEDFGCGIDTHCQDRIFDAFYTTRLHDDATGLGLSIAHSIVADHGGTIRVNSRLHQGATFIVHLPRYVECQNND